MLSLLDLLLIVVSTTPVSASPLRRWLNTTSSEAIISASLPTALPINATADVANAAADIAYATTSDDCEDTTSAPAANPTWPAALSTVLSSVNVAGGSYGNTDASAVPAKTYQDGDVPGTSTAPSAASSDVNPEKPPGYTSVEAITKPFTYGDWTSYYTDFATVTRTSSPPSYSVTNNGKHANATATMGTYGGAGPYGSVPPESTTTLTLYTPVESEGGGAYAASSAAGGSAYGSGAAATTTANGGQTTSMAAYTSPSRSETDNSSAPESSVAAYETQSAPAYSNPDTPSSSTNSNSRTTHRPTHTTQEVSSEPIPQYTTTTNDQPSSSSSFPYSAPGSSSSISTGTVDPVPTGYSAPSYSYSPEETSNTFPPADPPILPTSQAYTYSPPSSTDSPSSASTEYLPHAPTDSYETDSPALPTVVTDMPSSSTTTTSTSSSSSSTSMAGITIVPVNPYVTTVYMTVTDAGMTTMVAGPTVTVCA